MNILYNNKTYTSFLAKENEKIILKAKSKDGDIININKILEEYTNERIENIQE